MGNVAGHQRGRQHTQREGNKDRYATQAWQRPGMQVPLVRRDRDPPAPRREVTHPASEDERKNQRQEKNRKKSYRQLSPRSIIRALGGRKTLIRQFRQLSVAGVR